MLKQTRIVSVVAAFYVLAPTMGLAAPLTVPTGLNPGDHYRLVFVMRELSNAQSSDISIFNGIVTTAANSIPELAALGTTWRAIASTSTIDARDNTGTNWELDPGGAPIYDLAGGIIANSNLDLWDGTIDAPINHFSDGSAFPGSSVSAVWTGTQIDGTRGSNSLGQPIPTRGLAGTADNQWVTESTKPSDLSAKLYAMSDVLTVVPEPSSFAIAALGLIGLVAWRRRNASRTRIAHILLAIVACCTTVNAAEIVVKNDNAPPGEPVFAFDPVTHSRQGVRFAERLVAPVSGTLVGVQILWGSELGGASPSQQAAIRISDWFERSPEAALGTIDSPILIDGEINEFRYFDPATNLVPISIPVVASQIYSVDLEFLSGIEGEQNLPSILANTSPFGIRGSIYFPSSANWFNQIEVLEDWPSTGDFAIRAIIIPVPEPSSLSLTSLLAMCLAGCAFVITGRKRRRHSTPRAAVV